MKQTRSQPCDRADAEKLLEKARTFALYATLIDPLTAREAELSTTVSNAAQAGIAAADAICCKTLRKRPRSPRHNDALPILGSVPLIGPEAEKCLRVLLVAKPKSYLLKPLSRTETQRCIRAMRKLIDIAQESLRRE